MRQRGFRVNHITQTMATLTAVASPINNNSFVYCMALWVGVNSFVKYESKSALFMIKGKRDIDNNHVHYSLYDDIHFYNSYAIYHKLTRTISFVERNKSDILFNVVVVQSESYD